MSLCTLVLFSYIGWIDPCMVQRVRPYRTIDNGTERCTIYQPNNVSNIKVSINDCNEIAQKINELRQEEQRKW